MTRTGRTPPDPMTSKSPPPAGGTCPSPRAARTANASQPPPGTSRARHRGYTGHASCSVPARHSTSSTGRPAWPRPGAAPKTRREKPLDGHLMTCMPHLQGKPAGMRKAKMRVAENEARDDYHDPTAGIGGAPPARSALTLRLVLAGWGFLICALAAAAFVTVVSAPVPAAVAAFLAAAAAVDIMVVAHAASGAGSQAERDSPCSRSRFDGTSQADPSRASRGQPWRRLIRRLVRSCTAPTLSALSTSVTGSDELAGETACTHCPTPRARDAQGARSPSQRRAWAWLVRSCTQILPRSA